MGLVMSRNASRPGGYEDLRRGESRGHECPTCGSPVLVVAGDEGTAHYEPAGQFLAARIRELERKVRDLGGQP
jgi:hypothetical protein